MRIKILRLGSATREAEVPSGSTVADALAKADLDNAGYSLTVNGLGAGAGTALSDHDVVVLTPKIEGGIR